MTSQSRPTGHACQTGALGAGRGVCAAALAGRGLVTSAGDLMHPVIKTGVATCSEAEKSLDSHH